MGPIVLVLSYGFAKPIEIIKKLINSKTKTTTSNNSTATVTTSTLKSNEIKINDLKYSTYDYNIKNKYFEIVIKLLPYNEPINTLPEELLTSTEALIVSFDSADKTFLTHVPKLCKLAEDNSIELALLITGQLFDDCNKGLCYGDVKDICKHTFDVIETLNETEDEDGEQETVAIKDTPTTEATTTAVNEDYKEIIEALENHIWSNVASSSSIGGGSSSNSIVEVDSNKQKATKKAIKSANVVVDDDDDAQEDLDEQQLEAYEALLTNIVNFKNNSTNLNRNQMLDEAEKLAVLFADFMGDD